MEIEFQNTEKDLKSFNKFYHRNELQKRIFIAIIISLLVGYAFSGKPFEFTRFIFGVIVSGLLIIGLFYFIPYLVSLKKINRLIAKEPEYLGKKKLRITDEGYNFQWAWASGYVIAQGL